MQLKKESTLNRIIRILSSLPLAIGLLALLALFSGLSTFLPQGQESSFYISNYPVWGEFFLSLHLHNFFRSFVFLIPAGLFFINLFLCTVIRTVKEIKGIIPFKPGPDIVHIALLVLITGGFINTLFSQKATVLLSEGQEITLDNYTLRLDSFDFYTYRDGTPKDWISRLSLWPTENPEAIRSKEIEVNDPLRKGGYSFYQSSYKIIHSAELEKEGERFLIKNSYAFKNGDEEYLLSENKGSHAIFKIRDSHGHIREQQVHPKEVMGEFTLKKITSDEQSGILIVKEPAYIMNLISFILMFAGLMINYFQTVMIKKSKEQAAALCRA